MGYFILYPKNRSQPVKIVTHEPRADYRKYGHAEGPLKDKHAVKYRLNWMGIPSERRPKGYSNTFEEMFGMTRSEARKEMRKIAERATREQFGVLE